MGNKTTARAFTKFCDETSLHGLPYLNREMSKTWKMIWILFILAIWIVSSYVIVINVQHHLDATTMTTIESVMASLNDVTFPSVYICNINQVSSDIIRIRLENVRKNLLFDLEYESEYV